MQKKLPLSLAISNCIDVTLKPVLGCRQSSGLEKFYFHSCILLWWETLLKTRDRIFALFIVIYLHIITYEYTYARVVHFHVSNRKSYKIGFIQYNTVHTHRTSGSWEWTQNETCAFKLMLQVMNLAFMICLDENIQNPEALRNVAPNTSNLCCSLSQTFWQEYKIALNGYCKYYMDFDSDSTNHVVWNMPLSILYDFHVC